MRDNTDLPSESGSMILFYQTGDGKSRIEVKLESGTVWLIQAMISELYQTTKQNIRLHIRTPSISRRFFSRNAASFPTLIAREPIVMYVINHNLPFEICECGGFRGH